MSKRSKKKQQQHSHNKQQKKKKQQHQPKKQEAFEELKTQESSSNDMEASWLKRHPILTALGLGTIIIGSSSLFNPKKESKNPETKKNTSKEAPQNPANDEKKPSRFSMPDTTIMHGHIIVEHAISFSPFSFDTKEFRKNLPKEFSLLRRDNVQGNTTIYTLQRNSDQLSLFHFLARYENPSNVGRIISALAPPQLTFTLYKTFPENKFNDLLQHINDGQVFGDYPRLSLPKASQGLIDYFESLSYPKQDTLNKAYNRIQTLVKKETEYAKTHNKLVAFYAGEAHFDRLSLFYQLALIDALKHNGVTTLISELSPNAYQERVSSKEGNISNLRLVIHEAKGLSITLAGRSDYERGINPSHEYIETHFRNIVEHTRRELLSNKESGFAFACGSNHLMTAGNKDDHNVFLNFSNITKGEIHYCVSSKDPHAIKNKIKEKTLFSVGEDVKQFPTLYAGGMTIKQTRNYLSKAREAYQESLKSQGRGK